MPKTTIVRQYDKFPTFLVSNHTQSPRCNLHKMHHRNGKIRLIDECLLLFYKTEVAVLKSKANLLIYEAPLKATIWLVLNISPNLIGTKDIYCSLTHCLAISRHHDDITTANISPKSANWLKPVSRGKLQTLNSCNVVSQDPWEHVIT